MSVSVEVIGGSDLLFQEYNGDTPEADNNSVMSSSSSSDEPPILPQHETSSSLARQVSLRKREHSPAGATNSTCECVSKGGACRHCFKKQKLSARQRKRQLERKFGTDFKPGTIRHRISYLQNTFGDQMQLIEESLPETFYKVMSLETFFKDKGNHEHDHQRTAHLSSSPRTSAHNRPFRRSHPPAASSSVEVMTFESLEATTFSSSERSLMDDEEEDSDKKQPAKEQQQQQPQQVSSPQNREKLNNLRSASLLDDDDDEEEEFQGNAALLSLNAPAAIATISAAGIVEHVIVNRPMGNEEEEQAVVSEDEPSPKAAPLQAATTTLDEEANGDAKTVVEEQAPVEEPEAKAEAPALEKDYIVQMEEEESAPVSTVEPLTPKEEPLVKDDDATSQGEVEETLTSSPLKEDGSVAHEEEKTEVTMPIEDSVKVEAEAPAMDDSTKVEEAVGESTVAEEPSGAPQVASNKEAEEDTNSLPPTAAAAFPMEQVASLESDDDKMDVDDENKEPLDETAIQEAMQETKDVVESAASLSDDADMVKSLDKSAAQMPDMMQDAPSREEPTKVETTSQEQEKSIASDDAVVAESTAAPSIADIVQDVPSTREEKSITSTDAVVAAAPEESTAAPEDPDAMQATGDVDMVTTPEEKGTAATDDADVAAPEESAAAPEDPDAMQTTGDVDMVTTPNEKGTTSADDADVAAPEESAAAPEDPDAMQATGDVDMVTTPKEKGTTSADDADVSSGEPESPAEPITEVEQGGVAVKTAPVETPDAVELARASPKSAKMEVARDGVAVATAAVSMPDAVELARASPKHAMKPSSQTDGVVGEATSKPTGTDTDAQNCPSPNSVLDSEFDEKEANKKKEVPLKENRKIRFADEAGKPLTEEHLIHREANYASRIVVMLLSPKDRKFEFLHAEYPLDATTTVQVLLEQIPVLATNDAFRSKTFNALLQTETSRQLDNKLALQDYSFKESEIVLGVPDDFTVANMTKMAVPLLLNKKLMKTVKQAIRKGRGLKTVKSGEEWTGKAS